MNQSAYAPQWKKLLSCKRINDLKSGRPVTECITDPRNPFQRDCDRITYSYPFRRLQDKTQVIPLPVIDFVHTRLTHTLEVTTVGRSLGKLLENHLFENGTFKDREEAGNIPAIIAAACLAHDIGNPPFGHSGEDAISEYFKFGNQGYAHLEGVYGENFDYSLRQSDQASDIKKMVEVTDLQKFEGNAMGFRLLTKHDDTGLNLTCATLATFSKYPRQSYVFGDSESGRWDDSRVSQKKYGFFQTELKEFEMVADEVGLKKLMDPISGNYAWARHPLAFLMEAADDICYRIIDLEDGFRIGRIPFADCESQLINIASKDERWNEAIYKAIPIDKEKKKFGYLRGLAINVLIKYAFDAFKNNYEGIMSFEFDKDLISSGNDQTIIEALKNIKDTIRRYIYKWQEVLTVEAAGFEVLGELLEKYIEASNICLECPPESRSKRASKIFDLLPVEFQHTEGISVYERYLKIASYVSGMTDSYAINIFQRIKGIRTI